jgi:hypothetical protein
MKERTTYSEKFKGDKGNYGWPVSFDVTDGYIGISQTGDTETERVLLSPSQVKAMLLFLGITVTKDASHE